AARRLAILKPRIAKEFFERYRRAKFPTDVIAGNVLKSMGVPPERVEAALEIIRTNGRYAGIIRETPTGPFVNLDSPGVPAPTATPALPEQDAEDAAADQDATGAPAAAAAKSVLAVQAAAAVPVLPAFDAKANRVFISHGKQKAIASQIKELLAFGNFEPVVSVERESTAIPVTE